MAHPFQSMAIRATALCRNVTAALIAGVYRKRSINEINDWLCSQPARTQRVIICGVLGLLLGLSFVAAQFGWVGILVFWLAVIVIVN